MLRADGRVEVLEHIGQVQMQPGDVFEIHTPGGGGYGVPTPASTEATELCARREALFLAASVAVRRTPARPSARLFKAGEAACGMTIPATGSPAYPTLAQPRISCGRINQSAA